MWGDKREPATQRRRIRRGQSSMTAHGSDTSTGEKCKKYWRSTVASDQKNVGYHGRKGKKGYQWCSDRKEERKAVMPFNNNIIVLETYLGCYPVISKPREDVR